MGGKEVPLLMKAQDNLRRSITSHVTKRKFNHEPILKPSHHCKSKGSLSDAFARDSAGGMSSQLGFHDNGAVS